MLAAQVLENGWMAVPLDASQLFNGKSYEALPKPLLVDDIELPSDPIIVRVQEYAKKQPDPKVYNHSMRVYYFATAILRQQFPQYATFLSLSTLALTCLLHDIGTTDEYMSATNMSFEFYGGIKALNVLLEFGCMKDQAEAVCETIIRHQDIGTVGKITLLEQIIQLAAIYDNAGAHPYVEDLKLIIHLDTLDDIVEKFPRRGWLGCFSRTIEREVETKPWCHSTHIPGFKERILGNKLMQRFE